MINHLFKDRNISNLKNLGLTLFTVGALAVAGGVFAANEKPFPSEKPFAVDDQTIFPIDTRPTDDFMVILPVLDLTDEQRAKVRQLVADYNQKLKDLEKQASNNETAMQSAALSSNEPATEKAAETLGESITSKIKARMAFRASVMDVLNPEQQTKVRGWMQTQEALRGRYETPGFNPNP